MSACEDNFMKVTVPVFELPTDMIESDKKMFSQFIYNDNVSSKVDICIKKCASGSIPQSVFNVDPTKKLDITGDTLVRGAEFMCYDNPSVDDVKINNETHTVTYKCAEGVLSLEKDKQSKCIYVTNQYPLKKETQE
jgi:hypothetical protein